MKFFKLILNNYPVLLSIIFLLLIIISGLFSPQLAPHDPMKQNLINSLQPPFWSEGGDIKFPLGTDHLGRDILSQIIYGSRISLAVSISAVFLSGFFGAMIGLLSAYWGGIFEDLVMRVVDVQMAFPFILLALIVLAVLGPGFINIIIVLLLTNWIYYARISRAEVLHIKETEYVQAAMALGSSNIRIMVRHILPNMVNPLIVLATLRIASMVLMESSLSFLGLGITGVPTWGSMLSNGRHYITVAYWMTTFPGLAIFFTVLSVNLLGDWVRDVTDPHLKNF